MRTPIFYVPGHVGAVIALAIFSAVIIAVDVVLFVKFYSKKRKE